MAWTGGKLAHVRTKIGRRRFVEVREQLQKGPWKHLVRTYRGWRRYNPKTGVMDMSERYSNETIQRMVTCGSLDVYEFDEDGQVQVYALGVAFNGWRRP
jgi:hypothetical protein